MSVVVLVKIRLPRAASSWWPCWMKSTLMPSGMEPTNVMPRGGADGHGRTRAGQCWL